MSQHHGDPSQPHHRSVADQAKKAPDNHFGSTTGRSTFAIHRALRSPLKGASMTPEPPQSPVFKISLDVEVGKLVNLNANKLRDVIEWTLRIKAFFMSDTPQAFSDNIQITSLTTDLAVKLPISLDIHTYGDIDNLIHHPIFLNFYEIELITRDKKKQQPPEEKTELIGQSLIDLYPMVLGVLETEVSLPIFPPKKSVDPEERAESSISTAADDVTVSLRLRVSTPMIPEMYTKKFNILTLTVDGCYSMPESWKAHLGPAHSPAIEFTVATSVPSTAEHERYLVVPNRPVSSSPQSVSLDSSRRWPSHHMFISEAVHMTEDPAQVLEKGHLNDKVVIERPFVLLNTEFRCILPQEAEDSFKSKALRAKEWPIEIFNITYPEKYVGAKKKPADTPASVTEEPVITRHGVVYVDMESLFQPDVRSVSGGFRIHPFDAAELMLRTKRKSVCFELFGSGSPTSVMAEHEKSLTINVSKKAPDHSFGHKTVGSSPTHHTSAQELAHTKDEIEKQLYNTNSSYMYAKFSLRKALVAKHSRTIPKVNLGDVIPKHLRTPIPNDNGFLAVQQFHEEVRRMRDNIGSLYCQNNAFPKDWITAYQSIETQLSKSGQLYSVKSKLKDIILQLVRNRYYRRKKFESKNEYQEFLSDLYADLVREINLALSCVPPRDPAVQKPAATPANVSLLIKVLALEVELDGKFTAAEQYLAQRTLVSENDSISWRELGIFQLRHGKLVEAVKSFAESLKSDRTNINGLILLAYTFFEQGNQNYAQIFFEAVVALQPSSPIAWTILGLYYENLCDNPMGGFNVLKERAYYKANSILGLGEARLKEYRSRIKDQERLYGGGVPNCLTGKAACARSNEILQRLLFPVLPLDRQQRSADLSAPKSDIFPPSWNLEFYDGSNKRTKPIQDNIFWHSLPYLSGMGLFKLVARSIVKLTGVCELDDPIFWNSSVNALMQHGKYEEVGQILEEAVALGVKNATLFANAGHLQYIKQDFDSAVTFYEAAIGFGLEPYEKYPVFYRYGRLAESCQNYTKAREMFLAAGRLHETSQTWLGCGEASMQLGDKISLQFALEQANQCFQLAEKWGITVHSGLRVELLELRNKYISLIETGKDTEVQE